MYCKDLRICGFIGLTIFFFPCLNPSAARAQDSPRPAQTPASEETPSQSEPAQTREQQLEERVKELENKVQALSAQMEADSAKRLAEEAQNETSAVQEEPKPEERRFLQGALSLQKLNPEISFSGDILAGLIINDKKFYAGESDRSGMPVREVELHFQHALDPYSMFKSAISFSPKEGVGIEEVYLTWFGIVPSLSLTVGRFRQNFGVLNRWHAHELDQTDYPMAMTLVLGEEGLTGDGFAVKWLMPALWAHANELRLEVVDGDNPTLFSGEYFSIPSSMLHLKNYYDLSPSTYLELGLTGMFGFNNKRGLLNEQHELLDEPWRKTYAVGADLTLYWSPLQQAKYHSFTWRSEWYYANKEQPASEARHWRDSWGVYSYVQYQPFEQWFVGVRGDVALPTDRDSSERAWDVVPYVTFWQSEFVYLRLEYRHGWNVPYPIAEETVGRRTDDRVLLQVDFAAGPHKHEKY